MTSMRLVYLGIIVVILLTPFAPVFAQVDNNIIGMNVATINTSELQEISDLVTYGTGSWGYITFVIQDTDRDHAKWQGIFDQLKAKKLIPIVRLATHAEGGNWARPSSTDSGSWTTFLDGLNWPVTNRYIVLFNEPNHGQEWGGSVEPEDYGTVAKAFASALTTRDANFKVMIAGLDSAAPSANPQYETETTFLDRMLSTFTVNDMNQYLSGWASHSYPRNYTAPPTETGRNSIKNYEWELSWLNGKGVKPLPVFITETGWRHDQIGDSTATSYYLSAFQDVWMKDSRIKAVTPFVYDYPASPFDGFSWKTASGDFYPQANSLRLLPKIYSHPAGEANPEHFIFRFWSDKDSAHFYTESSQERNELMQNYDNHTWRYEGVAFKSLASTDPDAVPVYRFISNKLKTHFYTANYDEKNEILAKYPDDVWHYEGVAFYVYPLSYTGPNAQTMYRFWSQQNSKHFFTSTESEKNQIMANYPEFVWKYEGPIWKVPIQ